MLAPLRRHGVMMQTAVVVGAGVSGLQTARALLKRNISVVILEQNATLGGVWSNCYFDAGLQDSHHSYQFGEFPWPDSIAPGKQPSWQAVLRYVTAYAERFRLLDCIRFECQLKTASLDTSKKWSITYMDLKGGFQATMAADYLVICTGMGTPNLPKFKGTELFRGVQVHAKDVSDLALAEQKRVVVIGAGRSELECAAQQAVTSNAASITWLFSQVHWPIPRQLAAGELAGRLLFSALPFVLAPPYYTASASKMLMLGLWRSVQQRAWKRLEKSIRRQFCLEGVMEPSFPLLQDILYGGQTLAAGWADQINTTAVHNQERSRTPVKENSSSRGLIGGWWKRRDTNDSNSSQNSSKSLVQVPLNTNSWSVAVAVSSNGSCYTIPSPMSTRASRCTADYPGSPRADRNPGETPWSTSPHRRSTTNHRQAADVTTPSGTSQCRASAEGPATPRSRRASTVGAEESGQRSASATRAVEPRSYSSGSAAPSSPRRARRHSVAVVDSTPVSPRSLNNGHSFSQRDGSRGGSSRTAHMERPGSDRSSGYGERLSDFGEPRTPRTPRTPRVRRSSLLAEQSGGLSSMYSEAELMSPSSPSAGPPTPSSYKDLAPGEDGASQSPRAPQSLREPRGRSGRRSSLPANFEPRASILSRRSCAGDPSADLDSGATTRRESAASDAHSTFTTATSMTPRTRRGSLLLQHLSSLLPAEGSRLSDSEGGPGALSRRSSVTSIDRRTSTGPVDMSNWRVSQAEAEAEALPAAAEGEAAEGLAMARSSRLPRVVSWWTEQQSSRSSRADEGAGSNAGDAASPSQQLSRRGSAAADALSSTGPAMLAAAPEEPGSGISTRAQLPRPKVRRPSIIIPGLEVEQSASSGEGNPNPATPSSAADHSTADTPASTASPRRLAMMQSLQRQASKPQVFEPDASNAWQQAPPDGPVLVRPIYGTVAQFTPTGVLLDSGHHLQADLVVYCTGFNRTYDYLEHGIRTRLAVQKDGLFLYRNVLSPQVPQLAFVGSEVSTVNHILTSGLQAEWLAEHWSGACQLPSQNQMAEDIRLQMTWRRKLMPSQRGRSTVYQLYTVHYHKQLLKDLGLKGPRISLFNPTAPVTAADYRGAFTQRHHTAGDVEALQQPIPQEELLQTLSVGHNLVEDGQQPSRGRAKQAPHAAAQAVERGETGVVAPLTSSEATTATSSRPDSTSSRHQARPPAAALAPTEVATAATSPRSSAEKDATAAVAAVTAAATAVAAAPVTAAAGAPSTLSTAAAAAAAATPAPVAAAASAPRKVSTAAAATAAAASAPVAAAASVPSKVSTAAAAATGAAGAGAASASVAAAAVVPSKVSTAAAAVAAAAAAAPVAAAAVVASQASLTQMSADGLVGQPLPQRVNQAVQAVESSTTPTHVNLPGPAAADGLQLCNMVAGNSTAVRTAAEAGTPLPALAATPASLAAESAADPADPDRAAAEAAAPAEPEAAVASEPPSPATAGAEPGGQEAATSGAEAMEAPPAAAAAPATGQEAADSVAAMPAATAGYTPAKDRALGAVAPQGHAALSAGAPVRFASSRDPHVAAHGARAVAGGPAPSSTAAAAAAAPTHVSVQSTGYATAKSAARVSRGGAENPNISAFAEWAQGPARVAPTSSSGQVKPHSRRSSWVAQQSPLSRSGSAAMPELLPLTPIAAGTAPEALPAAALSGLVVAQSAPAANSSCFWPAALQQDMVCSGGLPYGVAAPELLVGARSRRCSSLCDDPLNAARCAVFADPVVAIKVMVRELQEQAAAASAAGQGSPAGCPEGAHVLSGADVANLLKGATHAPPRPVAASKVINGKRDLACSARKSTGGPALQATSIAPAAGPPASKQQAQGPQQQQQQSGVQPAVVASSAAATCNTAQAAVPRPVALPTTPPVAAATATATATGTATAIATATASRPTVWASSTAAPGTGRVHGGKSAARSLQKQPAEAAQEPGLQQTCQRVHDWMQGSWAHLQEGLQPEVELDSNAADRWEERGSQPATSPHLAAPGPLSKEKTALADLSATLAHVTLVLPTDKSGQTSQTKPPRATRADAMAVEQMV